MAVTYTHPHWETNVIDNSIYQALVREALPLHRPIFFMRAQQGPVGVPVWVNTSTEAFSTFGEGTFTENTEYYSRESIYLNKLFARQGAFIVRMAAADAQYGSLVLMLRVKRTQVKQYRRDSNGQFVLDPNTNQKIPLTDAQGLEISEPGVELKWYARAMNLSGDHVETLENLKPTTYGTGANEYTDYPIIAVKAKYVGAFSNTTGFKFFADLDDMDDTLANTIGSILYSFGLVKKTYGQDTVSPVRSFFGNQYESFTAKPNQQDTRVARNISFDDVMGFEYDGIIPWDIKLYDDNIKEVGEIIQDIEEDDETLIDPFMVNLTEPYNIEGIPMPHVVMSTDDDAIVLNDTRVLYLLGGADGSISDTAIEELTRQYLKDLIYPEILDQARYPFTHIYDTGVSIETKNAILQFMGKHDAFKAIMSTQDANMEPNTKNEDFSMGSALYATALLQPESVIKGTECCRAEIYQQCGYLADSTYRGVIPATLDIMMKKSQFQSTGSITGNAAGLPNSEITIFKSWNWTPCEADHKQKSWECGLNYFQFFDMTGIHWPAMRTVYRYDTSVLSSALYTDAVVYIKHIARYNWARFAGVEMDFALLSTRASAALSNDLSAMLNGFFKFTASFYQTEEEAKVGYIAHASIQLYGNAQQRVWKIDIECYRNGYDANTEEI